ncbi:MAG TPA: low molecular weight protein-tyrosine-phosphatase [Gammaproteobacteria bacterium]
MVNILFVCMGNICRSPTAEGVFTRLVEEAGLLDKIAIDSAGTHAYHVGEPPDPRAQKSALARGIDISHLRARRAVAEDFERFDYVLAMDYDNLQKLQSFCEPRHVSKLHLFLAYGSHDDIKEVPDPYYGGPLGFERVLDLIEDASHGLLQNILEKHANLK